MRLIIAIALVLATVACSEDPPGSAEGAGGSGGSAGGEGAGGAGGGSTLPPDEIAPQFSIDEPTDTAALEDPYGSVRGTATDDVGVAELWWEDPFGNRHWLPADGGPSIDFAFDLPLLEGENEITLYAKDAAGNEAAHALIFRYENTPGRPPEIVRFAADRPWANKGEVVNVGWRVHGTRPIELVFRALPAAPIDVTGSHGAGAVIFRHALETYTLSAENEHGSDVATTWVGVGPDLRIFPAEAVIAPGERQILVAENARPVEWSASGGEIVEEDGLVSRLYFTATEPGVYEVEATTLEDPPRQVKATITVREQRSSVRGIRGVGGQLAYHWGWHTRPLIDGDGRVWVAIPSRDALAWWHAAEGAWRFAGRQSWKALALVENTEAAPTAMTRAEVLRLDPADGRWHAIAPAPGEDLVVHRLQAGPDGTIFALAEKSLHALAPGASSWEAIELPESIHPAALAFGADGTLHLAGHVGGGRAAVHRADAEGWVELAGVQRPDDRIHDLLIGPDGAIYLASDQVQRWDGAAWTLLGLLPSCNSADYCGVRDLALRADGTLLAVTRMDVWRLEADDRFTEVGETIPEMLADGFGGLRAVEEAEDGALFLVGDRGVFTLPPEGGRWAVVGAYGLPPLARVGALLVEEDGSWILGSGDYEAPAGPFSLYRRDADGGDWTGFSIENEARFGQDEVWFVDRDGAGQLYAFCYAGRIYRIDEETDEWFELPSAEAFRVWYPSEVYGFLAAEDGTLFVSVGEGTFQLLPGADAWVEEPSLLGARDLERGPDGTLWAADGYFAYRRLPGTLNWEPIWEGLPLGLAGTVDLAVGDDGTAYLAQQWQGVFRLPPLGSVWERVGTGDPSYGAVAIASRAGRTWTVGLDGLYELDEGSGSWLRVEDSMLPFDLRVFEAAADGSLLFAGEIELGLFQTVD